MAKRRRHSLPRTIRVGSAKYVRAGAAKSGAAHKRRGPGRKRNGQFKKRR